MLPIFSGQYWSWRNCWVGSFQITGEHLIKKLFIDPHVNMDPYHDHVMHKDATAFVCLHTASIGLATLWFSFGYCLFVFALGKPHHGTASGIKTSMANR